jgi:hypothetical protein
METIKKEGSIMSAEAALKLVETNEVETKALDIVAKGRMMRVLSADDYIQAGALWGQIGDMIKEVKATFDPICEAAHKAHKAATAKRAQFLDPLESVFKMVKKEMSNYDLEQERIRREEQRRLEEIARKEEEERRLQEAILAEESGNKEEAQAIIEEPVYVAPVVIPKATPKMEGGPVYRAVTKFKIINESLIPRQYLTPDMVKIGGVVRALKQNANIPGIQVYEERV